jgi:hypothetical protein
MGPGLKTLLVFYHEYARQYPQEPDIYWLSRAFNNLMGIVYSHEDKTKKSITSLDYFLNRVYENIYAENGFVEPLAKREARETMEQAEKEAAQEAEQAGTVPTPAQPHGKHKRR